MDHIAKSLIYKIEINNHWKTKRAGLPGYGSWANFNEIFFAFFLHKDQEIFFEIIIWFNVNAFPSCWWLYATLKAIAYHNTWYICVKSPKMEKFANCHSWKWIIMNRKEIVRKCGIFRYILFSKWLAFKSVTTEFKSSCVFVWYQSIQLENKLEHHEESIFMRGNRFFDFDFTKKLLSDFGDGLSIFLLQTFFHKTKPRNMAILLNIDSLWF